MTGRNQGFYCPRICPILTLTEKCESWYGRQNNVPPQRWPPLNTLNLWICCLIGQAKGLWLRSLRWRDDPGLSGGWGEVVTGALIRRMQEWKWERPRDDGSRGWGDVLWKCRKGPGARNTGGPRNWKRQGNRFSPEPPAERLDLTTDCRFLNSRTQRE